jgi:rhodanese-related sulfurtransferase
MMPTTVQQMLSAANASVPKLSPSEASEKMKGENTLILDVRDPSEVEKTGRIKGAVNVSRGMLEFRADPESQFHNPAFQTDTVSG